MTATTPLRLATVLILVLTVQTTWLSDLRPFGAPGDLLLLVAIVAGMSSGALAGAVVGFIAGIAMDLVLLSPFGLSALVYLVVGYVAGSLHAGVIRSAPWIPVAVSLVASGLGVVFFVIVGQLLGQHFRLPDLPEIVLVTATINAAAVLPGMNVARWVQAGSGRRSLSLR